MRADTLHKLIISSSNGWAYGHVLK